MSGMEPLLFAAAIGGSAYAQVQAGRAQQFEYKAAADQAKSQARDVEIERRQRLLKSLAQRQVDAAAGGTTLEGSPMALINADEEAANMDSLSLQGQTSARVAALNASGRNARTVANLGAISTVLQGASLISGMGGAKSASGLTKSTGTQPTLGKIGK